MGCCRAPCWPPPSRPSRAHRPAGRPIKIHQRGVQWKQGVVVYMMVIYIYIYIYICFIIWYYPHPLHPLPTAPPCNEYPADPDPRDAHYIATLRDRKIKAGHVWTGSGVWWRMMLQDVMVALMSLGGVLLRDHETCSCPRLDLMLPIHSMVFAMPSYWCTANNCNLLTWHANAAEPNMHTKASSVLSIDLRSPTSGQNFTHQKSPKLISMGKCHWHPLVNSTEHPPNKWQFFGKYHLQVKSCWKAIGRCHWTSTMISEVSISGVQSFGPDAETCSTHGWHPSRGSCIRNSTIW